MHYRRLGHSGLKVSEISLGSWITFGGQIDEETAIALINAAYEQGINFFDNADMYANGQAEIVLGKAIKKLPREELVISSKVFWPVGKGPNARGLSRKHITEAVNASLKRLGLDYLDLYFCHRYDPDTTVEEVVRTMNDLIHLGKILYWGTSEWEAAQVMEAYGVARQYGLIPPTMEQPQYNLFHRKRVEDTLMPICRDLGIGLDGKLVFFICNSVFVGEYDIDGNQIPLKDAAGNRIPKVNSDTGEYDRDEKGEIRYLGQGEKVGVRDTKTLVELVENRQIENWLAHPIYGSGYLIPDPAELEAAHGMTDFRRRFNPLRFYSPEEVLEFAKRDIEERSTYLEELFSGQEGVEELAPIINVWRECVLPSAQQIHAFYVRHYGDPRA